MTHNWKLIFRNITTPGTSPDERFVTWSISETGSLTKIIPLKQFTAAEERVGMPAAEVQELYYQKINNILKESGILDISIDEPMFTPQATILSESSSVDKPINTFRIHRSGTYKLENLYINHLHLNPGDYKPMNIQLSNCKIKHLECVGSHPKISLNIEKSDTQKLTVSSNIIQRLEIHGGSILDIDCPTPESENPFVGDVLFNNVFFPRTTLLFPIKGPQAYRNLRHHLMANHNELAANSIHSAELALERETDSWMNKKISFFYELFSDFGSSALQPLMWWLGMFTLSVVIITLSGGAELALEPKMYKGWQKEALLASGIEGEVYKAISLTGQQILNPLGLLGAKGLTVAKYTWVLYWSFFYSLVSVLLITLLIFAIRRRFKLQ